MISVPSLQKIPTYLLDRKQGQVYDTYYRMFEEYAAVNIQPQMYQGVVNDQFVQNMDTAALTAFGKFNYVAKPANIPVEQYRQVLLVLNNIAVGGPTLNAVTKFLQLFDPTASLSQYTGNPIYSENSRFYNATTHSYPTPEYVILSEDSEFTLKPTEPTQLIMMSENSYMMTTSDLNVPSLITRQFIRDCLRVILPATVRVLLNFDLEVEFHFFDTNNADDTTVWSWDESSEELLQFPLATIPLFAETDCSITHISDFASPGYDSVAAVISGGLVYSVLIAGTDFNLSSVAALPSSECQYMEVVYDRIVYYSIGSNPIVVDPINNTTVTLDIWDTAGAFSNILLVKRTKNNNGFWVITGDLETQFGITVFTKDGVQVNQTTYTPPIANYPVYAQAMAKNLFCPVNLKKATSFNPMTAQHISIDITDANSVTEAIFTLGVNWGTFSEAVVSSMGMAYDSRDYFILTQAIGGTVHLGSFNFTHNFTDQGALPNVSFSTVQLFVEGSTAYGIVLTNKQIVRIDGVFSGSLTSETYSIPYPQTDATSLDSALTNTYDTILS